VQALLEDELLHLQRQAHSQGVVPALVQEQQESQSGPGGPWPTLTFSVKT
jgi:hypothetical protein